MILLREYLGITALCATVSYSVQEVSPYIKQIFQQEQEVVAYDQHNYPAEIRAACGRNNWKDKLHYKIIVETPEQLSTLDFSRCVSPQAYKVSYTDDGYVRDTWQPVTLDEVPVSKDIQFYL